MKVIYRSDLMCVISTFFIAVDAVETKKMIFMTRILDYSFAKDPIFNENAPKGNISHIILILREIALPETYLMKY